MKRFVFVLVFICLAFIVSAQYEEGFVEEMTGVSWRQWSYDQQLGYVQGFYSGYSSIWERMYIEIGGGELSEEDENFLEYLFYIDISIQDVISEINTFYTLPSNRTYKIYEVLMLVVGKDYWND